MFSSQNPSLYIHIPFCLAKCDYCDFFSVKCCGSVDDRYIDALISEISFYKKFYSVESWYTVYLGGGTPSLLSPEQLKRLLDAVLNLSSGMPVEITMEMNPETVTPEKLHVLKSLCTDKNVRRISLGVQSLNDSALKTVNRHCSAEKAISGLNVVKEYWDGRLNLDAIAGLPGLSDEDFIKGLKNIISCNPDHISMYTLTIEEGTKLSDRIEAGLEFDFDKADSQWLKGYDFLKENGYFQYEVSNFCKKDKESLHNLTYWKQNPYIGAGSGATGTVYDDSNGTGLRWTLTQNIEKYINFWTSDKINEVFTALDVYEEYKKLCSCICDFEEISAETREFEFLMMGFRTRTGVDGRKYNRLFKDLKPYYGNLNQRLESSRVWNDYVSKGYAVIEAESENEQKAYLTEKGILFLNELLTDFI